MRPTITVTLQIEIEDESQFRQTAHDQALREADSIVAATFLDPEQTTLANCAQMVFDPGTGPDGCSILGSDAEDVTDALAKFQ